MQRNRKYTLNFLDYFNHHFFFINLWQSNIYIKNISACIRLLHSLLQNIFHIMLNQSLFEYLFTGRIDSLPNHFHGIKFNQL